MFEAAAGTALSVIFLFLWIGVRRVVRFGMLVVLRGEGLPKFEWRRKA